MKIPLALLVGCRPHHPRPADLAAAGARQGEEAGAWPSWELLGMGSALETLCGQAVGTGQLQMLGDYMQHSWIICLATLLALLPLYLLASPVLCLLRQSPAIAAVSGRYARWCVPQLFAYAVSFPIQKFYQRGQGLGRGMVGAAIVGDVSWWLLNAAQFVYLVGGSFLEAWTGFSRKAFANLGGFVRLSITSAVMLWFVSHGAILLLLPRGGGVAAGPAS
ncbi:hypothetical protein C2845_PM03G27180 [Panicum miliaceum]|uniref:Uncharacterized protein n=1 Tax=Panicum miliaceum TaxID=4540 RepID=A0A3L6T9H4_PANMI|nr:hypothetical protein C2845_PM03G27180 [Panicum miliaceum]